MTPNEIAKKLSTKFEKVTGDRVRRWIRELEIQPVAPGRFEEEVLERLKRLRKQLKWKRSIKKFRNQEK